jgi:hypothetical protein
MDIWSAAKLPFVINHVLPVGVQLLHGKPKSGMSWLALDYAYAVASGGKAIPVNVATLRQIDGAMYGLTHFATCPHGRAWRKRQ